MMDNHKMNLFIDLTNIGGEYVLFGLLKRYNMLKIDLEIVSLLFLNLRYLMKLVESVETIMIV